ncbi:MAG TPA: hypothetical protein VNH44_01745 [Micropepsaceae bacterium]|nr:hypothetical protein [Micropepsaceae bacterium]
MMAAPRFPADDARKTILQYRKLADQAKVNAEKAGDEAGKEWFLSLAKTMTALADALESQRPK